MSVVSKDIAEKEVNEWLTAIGTSEDQKEGLKNNVQILMNGVVNGALVIDSENQNVTQKLRVVFGKEEKISQLNFKPYLTVGEIETFKKSISQDNDNRNTSAAICASTGNPYSVIEQMNAKDFNLSAALVLFFIV